ncbi:MAG: C-GCAxxG-C-C family protein, partial [Oscillospiraceae bacterium]
MKRIDRADMLHESGFNCAQSVLAVCGDLTGLDENTALALAGGLGGGLRTGEICGAVNGAVMAVGLANPYTDPNDKEAKKKIALLAKECTKAFKDKFGSLTCRDLKRNNTPG